MLDVRAARINYLILAHTESAMVFSCPQTKSKPRNVPLQLVATKAM
jgi:hypothetical protein